MMVLRAVAALSLAASALSLTITPKPSSVTPGQLMGVGQQWNFKATGENSAYLRGAFTRYYSIIFDSATHSEADYVVQTTRNLDRLLAEGVLTREAHAEARTKVISGGSGLVGQGDALPARTETHSKAWQVVEGCDVKVKTADTNLTIDTDESYTLTVKAPRATIEAATVFGAMHGLESLSQLVHRGTTINGTVVTDKPRYNFRAVMIDTARHWYNVEVILQHLDAMAYAKMNVMHWHVVDSDAFPFQSTTFPEMSMTGAYSPNHIYTHSDIRTVVEYALARGIRVLPEFDTPGHVQRGWESTGLLTDCYDESGAKTGTGPLNPTLNATYDYLKKFYREVQSVFAPEKFVHVGGDEVPFDCWTSNPQIQKWMKANGLTDFADLETQYEQKLLNMLKDQGTSYMVWQEIFDNGAKILPDTVIDVWKGGDWQEEMEKVTKAGFHTVLSAPFYLNYISYGDDWKKYYAVEPSNFTGGEAATAKGLVGGVEACFWSEFIDATNFIPRAWPRTVAVAERGWSSKDTRDPVDAFARFNEWRCKLIARGINAEPLDPTTFCPKEFVPAYTRPW